MSLYLKGLDRKEQRKSKASRRIESKTQNRNNLEKKKANYADQ